MYDTFLILMILGNVKSFQVVASEFLQIERMDEFVWLLLCFCGNIWNNCLKFVQVENKVKILFSWFTVPTYWTKRGLPKIVLIWGFIIMEDEWFQTSSFKLDNVEVFHMKSSLLNFKCLHLYSESFCIIHDRLTNLRFVYNLDFSIFFYSYRQIKGLFSRFSADNRSFFSFFFF